MNINKLNPSISFKKHFINVDIGASSIKGSLKICAINEKNETIAKQKLTVFNDKEQRNEDKFEINVAKKIAEFEKANKQQIKQHDKDNQIQLTVCYPGPQVKTNNNSTGFFISNFYYDDLRHERFTRAISPQNIDTLLKQRGVNVVQSRHTNDMAGAGACIVNKLQQQYPEVLEKKGSEILYLYPGGGLGTGFIMIDNDNIKIKPSEIQHVIKHGTRKDSLESDVGAAKLRQSFAEELNLSKEEEIILGENTKAVTDFEECNKLFPHITKKKFEDASRETILNYMDSLAQLIAIKVCESKLDTVVLTGNIANGIRNAVNTNSTFIDHTKDFDKVESDNFSATLKRKIKKSLSNVGQKLLGKPEDLKIIFLQISDNTDGAHILQKGTEVGSPTAWYNIYNI